MPKYTVTDPTTNKSVDLEGDSPPTEEELNQIFSTVHGDQTSQPKPQMGTWDTIKAGWNQAKQSPILTQSPIGALGKMSDLANQGFNALGEDVSKRLSAPSPIRKNPINGKMFRDWQLPPQVGAAAGVATSLIPTAAMFATTPPEAPLATTENEAPGLLQKLGARGVNNSAGITPKTLSNMAGSQNPARVGTNLGTSLVNENAIGLSPASTFDKSKAVMDKFGQDVGTAIDKIKASGVPTSVHADEALQPLVDKWTALKDSALQGTRALAKPFEEIYGKLAEAAKSNGGQVELDHVRDAMDEVGQGMQNVAKDSPKYEAYSKLYGTLADIRKQIVEKIASTTGDQQLSQDLLKANEGYSRYSRIMPDIRKAAAKEGTSQFPLFSPFKGAVKAAQPLLSRMATKVGQGSAKLDPAMSAGEAIDTAANEASPNIIQFPPRKPKSMFRKAG